MIPLVHIFAKFLENKYFCEYLLKNINFRDNLSRKSAKSSIILIFLHLKILLTVLSNLPLRFILYSVLNSRELQLTEEPLNLYGDQESMPRYQFRQPTRCLAPIDFLKIPALGYCVSSPLTITEPVFVNVYGAPEIDSEESISPAYVAWRASTTNRVSYRPASLRIDTWSP